MVIFFFFKSGSWEKDTSSAFLRVLQFLNLSEAQRQVIAKGDLWILSLTSAFCGWDFRTGSLYSRLYRLSHSQPLKFAPFRLSFQKGKTGGENRRKSQEVHSACRRQVHYVCKPTVFVVFCNKMQ